MVGVDVHRARRWFWTLLAVAVLASGALSWAVTAPPGALTAGVLFVSGLVAAASLTQAVRIVRAVSGPLDLRLHYEVDEPNPGSRSGRDNAEE